MSTPWPCHVSPVTGARFLSPPAKPQCSPVKRGWCYHVRLCWRGEGAVVCTESTWQTVWHKEGSVHNDSPPLFLLSFPSVMASPNHVLSLTHRWGDSASRGALALLHSCRVLSRLGAPRGQWPGGAHLHTPQCLFAIRHSPSLP